MALSDPKFRVCHQPQVPSDQVFVQSAESLELARFLADTLVAYDLFQYENYFKPDYTNNTWIESQTASGEWQGVGEDDEESP